MKRFTGIFDKFDNILVGGCSWCEHPFDYEYLIEKENYSFEQIQRSSSSPDYYQKI